MTKLITDFSLIELNPEFDAGSNSINLKSDVPNLRSGISLTPAGSAAVGLNIYNTDSLTDYGFAGLYIHPTMPDTLVLGSRAVGAGVEPLTLHSLLKLKSDIIPTEASDVVNKKYVDTEMKNVGVSIEPTVTYNDPSANYIKLVGGKYYVYATTDYTAEKYEITPPDTSLHIATESVSYFVYAEYTVGGGVVAMTTDQHGIHRGDRAVICRVIRTGTTFHVTHYNHLANGLPEKLNSMTEHVLGYNVAEGLVISVPATRMVKCDAGIVWYGGTELSLVEIDTSGVDSYVFVYWNGSAWVFSMQTQLNNTQYNSSTGLHNITGSRMAINWIYRGVESQKHLYILLGTGNFNEDDALASGAPTPPSWVTDHAILLGRVMFVRNSNTVAYNQTVSQLGYTITGAVRHNDTTDRQGGTTNEYYHLTSAQHTDLTDSGDATIHYHATDRDRANHTGTQLAATVSDFGDAVLQALGAVTYETTGFQNLTTGYPTGTTLSWSDVTRTVTLAPTGANFSFWLRGKQYTKTTQSRQIANTSGVHFVYFDANGDIANSTVPWDLLTVVPVCAIYWNATLGKGIAYEERHGVVMDGATHTYLHATRGTQFISGGAIAGYTVAPGSPANANNTFSIAETVVSDEDLRSRLTAVADGGPYMVAYRSGASGEWTWDSTLTVPYITTGADFAINTFSGTWGLTALTSNNYANVYVVGVPSISTGTQFMLIPGQASYASLATAQSESFSSLSTGELPFAENVIMWQITFQRGAGYSTTGKVRIAAAPVRIIGNASIVTTGVNVHNNLSGLQGGTAGEYFHLTSAEYTGTGTGSFVRSSAPTISGNLTVGTIVSGTWNGSAIGLPQGGTGQTSAGLSNQILGTNNLASGTEWKSILGGTGITVSHTAGQLTITATGGTTPAAHGTSHATGGADPIYGSQTANYFLAAPSGSAGAPTFRAITTLDIPTLNQSTTGSAGSVANAATFNNGGAGDASGTTFNGAAARTISYNTLGAAPTVSPTFTGTVTVSNASATAVANNMLIGVGNNDTNFQTLVKCGVNTAGAQVVTSIGMDYSTTYTDLAAMKFWRTGGAGGEVVFCTGSVANGNERLRIGSTGILTALQQTGAYSTTPFAGYGLSTQVDTSGVCHIDSYSNGGSTSIAFGTNASAAAIVERMRIDSSGVITLGGTSTAPALRVSGGNTRWVTVGGSATTPTIGTNAGPLTLLPNASASGALEYVHIFSNLNGNTPALATNLGLFVGANLAAGNGEVDFFNPFYIAAISYDFKQITSSGVSHSTLRILPGATNGRYISIAPSSTNPYLTVSAGSLAIGVKGSAPVLRVEAMDGSAEGGEFCLGGAAAYGDISIDNRVGTMRISNSGGVFFTAATNGDVTLTGTLYATAKSFRIPHPTKPDSILTHGSLEGPENGVYVRGRTKTNIIDLPEYWSKLVDEDSITVTLTSIGFTQKLIVERIAGGKVYIKNKNLFRRQIDCYYVIHGERKDIDKLEVENG